MLDLILGKDVNEYNSDNESDVEMDNEMEAMLYSQVHYSSNVVLNNSSQEEGEDCDDGAKESKTVVAEEYPEVNVGESYVLGLSREDTGPEEKTEGSKEWDIEDTDKGMERVSKALRYYKSSDQLPNISCYNCNEKGHLARDCTAPKKTPICYLCGQEGHIKMNCPNDLCYNCMEMGHVSKDCTERKKKPFFYMYCSRCQIKGHTKEECSEIWRQFHVTVSGYTIIKPSSRKRENKQRYCYNCAASSHFGENCQKQRYCKRPVFSQFIVSYDKCKGKAREHRDDEVRNSKERKEINNQKVNKDNDYNTKGNSISVNKAQLREQILSGYKDKGVSDDVQENIQTQNSTRETLIPIQISKEKETLTKDQLKNSQEKEIIEKCETKSNKKSFGFLNTVKKICSNLKKPAAVKLGDSDETVCESNNEGKKNEKGETSNLKKTEKKKKSREIDDKNKEKKSSMRDSKKKVSTKDNESENSKAEKKKKTSKQAVEKELSPKIDKTKEVTSDKVSQYSKNDESQETSKRKKRKLEKDTDQNTSRKRRRSLSKNPWVNDADFIDGVVQQKFSLYECLGISDNENESGEDDKYCEKETKQLKKKSTSKSEMKQSNSDKKQKNDKEKQLSLKEKKTKNKEKKSSPKLKNSIKVTDGLKKCDFIIVDEIDNKSETVVEPVTDVIEPVTELRERSNRNSKEKKDKEDNKKDHITEERSIEKQKLISSYNKDLPTERERNEARDISYREKILDTLSRESPLEKPYSENEKDLKHYNIEEQRKTGELIEDDIQITSKDENESSMTDKNKNSVIFIDDTPEYTSNEFSALHFINDSNMISDVRRTITLENEVDDSPPLDCYTTPSPNKRKKLKMDYASLKNLADILVSDEDDSFYEQDSSAMSQPLHSPCINISDEEYIEETENEIGFQNNIDRRRRSEGNHNKRQMIDNSNDLTRYDPASVDPASLRKYGLLLDAMPVHHSRSAPDLRNVERNIFSQYGNRNIHGVSSNINQKEKKPWQRNESTRNYNDHHNRGKKRPPNYNNSNPNKKIRLDGPSHSHQNTNITSRKKSSKNNNKSRYPFRGFLRNSNPTFFD